RLLGPISALKALARARGYWVEVVRLLEVEERLAPRSERASLLAELGTILAVRLDEPSRAAEALESATALNPTDAASLERLFELQVLAPNWERAAHALERLLAVSPAVADAAERYFRVGLLA